VKKKIKTLACATLLFALASPALVQATPVQPANVSSLLADKGFENVVEVGFVEQTTGHVNLDWVAFEKVIEANLQVSDGLSLGRMEVEVAPFATLWASATITLNGPRDMWLPQSYFITRTQHGNRYEGTIRLTAHSWNSVGGGVWTLTYEGTLNRVHGW